MKPRRRVRPQVESLESLALLSAVPGLHAHGHAPEMAAAPSPGTAITLEGSEKGTVIVRRTAEATVYTITLSGQLAPIGTNTGSGFLHVINGISMGPPNGTLVLTTSTGTLTLQIPESVMIPAGVPNSPSHHVIVDTYTITGGTGAYAGDTGHGVVEFAFKPAKLTPGPRGIDHGRVTVTFLPLTTPSV